MPSAELLTPLVDARQDQRILLLWADASSVGAPAVLRERGKVLDLWLSEVVRQPEAARFAECFYGLREQVRLPAEKYARLLGVSRRTLYNWLETGRPADQAVYLVERLGSWVDELEPYLTASDLRQLLDPEVAGSIGALLASQELDAAAELVRAVADEASRPRRARRLGVLADDPHGEPPSVTADELQAAFSAFTSPRPASAQPGGDTEPPELTY